MLWTFAAVAVLAAEFARAMHDEAASTRNFKESTRARMVALAAVSEVILAIDKRRGSNVPEAELFEDEEGPDPVRALDHGDGQWVPATFRGNSYEVRVIDEAGKLPLNKPDAAVFRTIFHNLEIPDDDGEIIADSIVDWQDEDDFHQPNGAESEYYEGLNRPYRAKNAAFDTVEELLLVRGVTREIFYGHDGIPGLREIFSVFNKGGINPGTASPAVMQALTGLDREETEEFGDQRRGAERTAALQQIREALGAAGVGTRGVSAKPQDVTIEVRVRDVSGDAVLAHIGAVLRLPGGGGDGLKLYRWYDSIFDDSDDSAGTSASAEAAS